LFSVQHFWPFSQQPSFASATQQADFTAQQAIFFMQQLACFATSAPEQQAATLATAFFGPQHAFASWQQAERSAQHF
jgi:hypothetical protein